VEQFARLRGRAFGEVDQRSPGLILSAVGQFMRQHRQAPVAALREKDMVAQRDGSIAANPEDQIA
jgi:hypothetical protein